MYFSDFQKMSTLQDAGQSGEKEEVTELVCQEADLHDGQWVAGTFFEMYLIFCIYNLH